ncbi:MAG: catalase [Paracoccaceae bacterium]|jgi:catalase
MNTPDLAQRLVNAVISDAPDHAAGTRPVHTIGVGVKGDFIALPIAREYCVAEHFNGGVVPVTIRFSNGSGSPAQHDGRSDPRGMATRFHLESGPTDLIAMTLREFFSPTIKDFFELTAAAVPRAIVRESSWRKIVNMLKLIPALPDPPSGETHDNAAGLLAYANGFHTAAPAVLQAAAIGAPLSYARATYHAVHTFVAVAPDGRRRHVRFTWQPVSGVRRTDPKAPEKDIYLKGELETRLARWPARFILNMTVGEVGDALDDPTKSWPQKRIKIAMGTLTLKAVAEDQVADCEKLSFNPCRLTPGLELSDDPILRARRDAYETSREMRGATACPFNEDVS